MVSPFTRRRQHSKLPGIVRQLGGLALLAAFYFAVPHAAWAVDELSTEVGQVLDYGDFISKVWAWASRAIFAIAVLGVVIGGVMFAASNGDEERADIGRQTIRGSVIGIFIVLFSAVFNRFINSPVSAGRDEQQTLEDFIISIEGAANNFVAIVGAVSAVGLVASGIRLITASADELKIEKAKNGIKYSVLGLILSMSAWGILRFILAKWTA